MRGTLGAARISGRARWAIVAVACTALAASSLALQNAADFDPWGWIVWGREVLHLSLSTTQGPSWKPGAVLFTTIFALFGGLAPSLWLITTRLGALLAVVAAYRVASRLGGRFAGALAAVLVLVIHGFFTAAIHGQAEPLMVGFLLWAIDRALAGADRTSLILLVLASLLRPEVWPLLGAYSLYLWLKSPIPKLWIVAAWGVLGLLWFGGDWWGAGDPFLSSTRAKQFVLFHPNQHFSSPGLEVLKLTGDFLHRPAILLAVAAVVVAVVRRERLVIALAVAAGAMLATVAVMAQDGYPVLDRFLFGTLALAFVLSAIGAGYAVRILSRGHTTWAVLLAAGVLAMLGPLAVNGVRSWIPDMKRARQWAHSVNTLPQAIAAAGGRQRLVACRGSITTYFLLTPALAWDLHVHMTRVVTRHHGSSGILILGEKDRVSGFEPQRPLQVRTIARAAGWRVVDVVTHRPAPAGC